MSTISINKITDSDISLIASWYLQEWNIPIDRTTKRLLEQAKDDVIFQLILKVDGTAVATGGLYDLVGLLIEHPRFKQYGPWVALLYTDKQFRSKGFGRQMLRAIEKAAMDSGHKEIFLFTSTAEQIYLNEGWIPMERVTYRESEHVVMTKIL